MDKRKTPPNFDRELIFKDGGQQRIILKRISRI
jgi:hypothetical protein